MFTIAIGFAIAGWSVGDWAVSAVIASAAAALAIWRTRHRPLFVTVQLYWVSAFVVVPVLMGDISTAGDGVRLYATWQLGWLAPILITRHADLRTRVRLWGSTSAGRSVNAIATAALLMNALELLMVLQGTIGYAGQIAGGVPGWAAFLVAGAKPAALGAYIASYGSAKHQKRARFMVAGSLVLAFLSGIYSGFKGSVLLLALALFVVHSSTLPGGRLSRKSSAATLLSLVAVVGFLAAAQVRADTPQRGAPTVLSALEVSQFGHRVNLAHRTQVAVNGAGDASAQAAVSFARQIRAGVPRILMPSKGAVDYGRDVSAEFYGIPRHIPTSSTLSFIGDAYVNVGAIGVLVLAILSSRFTLSIHDRLVPTSTPISATLLAVLTYYWLTPESPMLLNIVGSMRSLAAISFWYFVSLTLTFVVSQKEF